MRQQITIILTLAFVFSNPSSSQPVASPLRPFESPAVYIAEGIGIDGIAVGYSTMSSVVAKYGEGFELVEHNKYSYEMKYWDSGLSFWYRNDDRAKKIFCIAIKRPCHGFTARGIVVGESTLQDVFNAYGKSEFHTTTAEETWFCEYPGVEFHVEYDPKERASWSPNKLLKKKVIEIDIIAIEHMP